MNQKHQKESSTSTKPQAPLKISAKKVNEPPSRICQGDIFEDIEILEDIQIENSEIIVKKISFPYVVCLNQECDLEQDFKKSGELPIDGNLLHLAIAPAFIFEQFLSGNHWGEIIGQSLAQKRSDTNIKKIIDNEIPRYHYLKFPEEIMPELIIDYKHFFTVQRNVLYGNIEKRMCSLQALFKEKINQRFSNYISRIGLPER